MKHDFAKYPAVILVLFCTVAVASAQSAKELLRKAQSAYKGRQYEKAAELAGKAIEVDPKNAEACYIRGAARNSLRRLKGAFADLNKALALNPKLAAAWNERGAVHFKSGRIKESIADFDRYLKLKPQNKPRHWQRGISFYYAKRYQDGKRQFEGYQTYDSSDVENGVWRYLCMVPLVGRKKARADMLKIGEDKRVPMRQIYDLFIGKLKPKDVLAAATAGDLTPAVRNKQLFYAHLYLGLYFESERKPAKALEHLEIAVKHRIGHYMWDVAKVHRDMLRK